MNVKTAITGLVGIGVMLVPTAAWAQAADPSYAGKPMSHWLALLREPPKDPKKPEPEWSRAPVALAQIGEPAVRGITLALQDPFAGTRRRAATSLVAMGPKAKDAAPALVTALKDRETAVRQMSATALGEIQVTSTDVVAALMGALKDAEPRVREAAATSLGRLHAAAAVPTLEAGSRDPNKAVQAASLKALSRIREASPSPNAP
jgi:HEAT repeat protein